MKKWALLSINAIIFAIGVLLAFLYAYNVKNDRIQAQKEAFASTVESMENVSIGHLRSQQEAVNSWAKCINANSLTVADAMEMLRDLSVNSSVTAHIIDAETYTGYSTMASVTDLTTYDVDYTSKNESIRGRIEDIARGNDADNVLQVIGTYINPIDGQQVVGFGSRVFLHTESADDNIKPYVLVRLVSINALQEQWVFPTGYEEAEVGLISNDGSYIVRSKTMKSENFWEFLRAYNGLTYPQQDELKARVAQTRTGILEYKNSREEDAYWAYSYLDTFGEWIIVGYLPKAALGSQVNDWTLVYIIGSVFLVLFAIDGIYFISMNKRLRVSMEEANSANQAKTRFLSSMSHDIRTPMNAVVGMTAVAMRNIDDKERVQDCLRKVALASNHLLTLINDILDISKVESGQFNLNPTVFSLPELMLNLTNIVRTQVGAKALDFRVHVVHMQQEYLYADELRINQIFINILSNAVKYTPMGGCITLTLEQQTLADDPKTVRLVYTVADTGIGMSEEFTKTMFEPFTRAKDSQIDTIQGSGLGLAITKRMVDAMHGTIEVQSELGKGSTFKVTLDIPAAEKMTDELILPPMRMLVVDDDAIFLETAVDMLDSMGIKADTASGGRQGVEMAVTAYNSGKGYPIIIIDWKMPEMDGIATIRAIRRVVGKDVSIIILSAFDWADIEQEAIEAGANGFINKPIFRSTLYNKINELIAPGSEKPADDTDEDAEELRGMHLLVAEDNEMNWEIIQSLLGFYDITADWAQNGAICVQKLTQAPAGTYQAVLMDIQMPVMNGYEATKHIRNSDIKAVRGIPIIAMTANAFAEDVRACLDAGMNAHVAKPVDMKQLVQNLKKFKLEDK